MAESGRLADDGDDNGGDRDERRKNKSADRSRKRKQKRQAVKEDSFRNQAVELHSAHKALLGKLQSQYGSYQEARESIEKCRRDLSGRLRFKDCSATNLKLRCSARLGMEGKNNENCEAILQYQAAREGGKFYLAKFTPHACQLSQQPGQARQYSGVTAMGIAAEIELVVSLNPLIPVADLQNMLNRTHQEIKEQPRGSRGCTYYPVRSAANAVIAKHYGCDSKNLYAILPALARYLEVLDPQTEVAWETGAGEVYESMVIISGAAKRAASGPGLVPVLSVDAAGMKGIGDRFPEGKMYLATMTDGSKKVHIVGAGHGGNESAKYWTSFLAPVIKAVDPVPDAGEAQASEGGGSKRSTRSMRSSSSSRSPLSRPSVIADEHKSIEAAIREIGMDSAFTLCKKHKAANVRHNFGVEAEALFHRAAACFTEDQLAEVIRDVEQHQKDHPKAMQDGRNLRDYIMNDAHRYIEARVPYSRYGISSTQATEAINSAPGVRRSPLYGGGFHRYRHPVFACVGYTIWEHQRLHYSREKESNRAGCVLTKYAEDTITKRIEASKDECAMETSPGTLTNRAFHHRRDKGATVVNNVKGTSYTVNVKHRTCTCEMWQKQCIPCKHACEVLVKLGHDPRFYTDTAWRRVEVLSMLDRAIGGRPGPSWEVVHDLVENNGILSDAGLKAVHSAVRATPGGPFPKESLEAFSKAWREEESRDLPPKKPKHFIGEDGKCPCPLCDGKITRKNKRGRKRRARIESTAPL